MNFVIDYLDNIKTKILISPAVKSLAIITERVLADRDYFCARLTLANDDFLEVSEYFVVVSEKCSTIEYRYQWMDGSRQRLIKRWDNAEHFPKLPNFPHHIHVGSETEVIPGICLSIMALIDLLESEII